MLLAGFRSRRRFRLGCWLGLWALCAQVWLSGIGHAHMAQRLAWSAGLNELCSAQARGGWVRDFSAPTAELDGAQHASASGHCPVCALAVSVALPVAQAAPKALGSVQAQAWFAPGSTGVPRARVRGPAQPRAPPSWV